MTAATPAGPLELPGVEPLFPAGTRRVSRRPGRGPSLLVLPSRRSPRLLVPSDVSAARDMLQRHSSGRLQRVAQDCLAYALQARVLHLLPVSRLVPVAGDTDPTIEDHVRDHVPGAARVGVLLGPPRANGKPVLRVFDASGRTLAFGKVAHDELSSRLVSNEARVLTELSTRTFQHLETPRVLHAGTWRGRAVLYQTPLRVAPSRRPEWRLPLIAMRELAESDEIIQGAVGDSAYAESLRSRVRVLERSPWLATALTDILQEYGDIALQFGRWHGDWAPWNTGSNTGRLHVWDWERSATGVPLGLDVVHFLAQHARARSPEVNLVPRLTEQARHALAGWCPDGRAVRATVLLYVVEVLQRYLADAGDTPTAALRQRIAVLRSLLPVHTTPHGRQARAGA